MYLFIWACHFNAKVTVGFFGKNLGKHKDDLTEMDFLKPDKSERSAMKSHLSTRTKTTWDGPSKSGDNIPIAKK